jgi:glycosyltransferase involved in cell wall biosynthesis
MSSSPVQSDWNCSIVSWGHPSDPGTFSGYTRSLVGEMRKSGHVRNEYSIKSMRWHDAFAGAFHLKAKPRGLGVAVRRSWMWSERASQALQKRLATQLERAGDRGSFLQIGTLVEIDPTFGEYAVLGDMTIPQAYRDRKFAVGGLSDSQYHEAVAVQQRVLRGASQAFTLTDWARQSMIDDFGMSPDRVTTVYMGTTLQTPPSVPVEKKPRQILFVGIDWLRKGGPQLVEGFRLLRQRLSDAELVIVGCAPEIDCPGVKVEGFLDPRNPHQRARVASLYRESACFALMSDFEPLGNVLIEAYAVGLPVIAFDSGSRSEIVRDGETGFLCADREPKTIANALLKLLEDPKKAEQLGKNALERVKDCFDWQLVAAKISSRMSSHRRSSALTEIGF